MRSRRPTSTYSVLSALFAGAVIAAACTGDDGGGKDTDAGTDSAATETGGSGTTGSPTGTTAGSATDSGTTDSGGSDTGTSTSTGGSDTGTTTNTTGGGGAIDCGGKVYQCTNGLDDDGDGFFDLNDPECTGPCDDDEGSFSTGIPGDNMDCKQDCFFDGDSGQGNDGCDWNLKCDPENPGENIGCAYTGGTNCDNQPPQTQDCIDFCSQFVPNGCDCFGCCTVDTPQGEKHIFLNGDPNCSLNNLDACTECTPQQDCGNPCEPEKCEVCFGEDAPPDGCDNPGCEGNIPPCMVTEDCPAGTFCVTGCCYPIPG